MILALENAQFIDPESIRYLNAILRAAPSARLIYEYTDGAAEGSATLAYLQFRDACVASELGLVEIPWIEALLCVYLVRLVLL